MASCRGGIRCQPCGEPVPHYRDGRVSSRRRSRTTWRWSCWPAAGRSAGSGRLRNSVTRHVSSGLRRQNDWAQQRLEGLRSCRASRCRQSRACHRLPAPHMLWVGCHCRGSSDAGCETPPPCCPARGMMRRMSLPDSTNREILFDMRKYFRGTPDSAVVHRTGTCLPRPPTSWHPSRSLRDRRRRFFRRASDDRIRRHAAATARGGVGHDRCRTIPLSSTNRHR